MAELDSLEIKISSDAAKANNAINSLVRNLGRLSNSLKIDTSGLEKIEKSLNFSGIDKASKTIQSQTQKVSKSLSQITEQYKNLGKGFEIKGSTQQIQKQIDSLTNQLAKAKLVKEDFETSGKTNLAGYETAVKNAIKYTNQIESLKKQLATMQNERPKLDLDTSGLEERKKYIIEYKKELLDFKKDIQSITDVYGGFQNAPKGTFDIPMENLKISIQELKRDYPQATEVIALFEKELLRLQDISSKLTREPTRAKIDTNSFDRANEKIQELKNKFDKAGMDFKFTGNFEQLKSEIQKAYSELNKLFAKEKEMISTGKIDTVGFEKLQESIAKVGNKIPILEDLRDRTNTFNQSLQQLRVPEIRENNLTKLQNSLRKTEENTEKLRIKLENQISMGNIIPNIDDSGFRKLTEQIALSEKQVEALRNKIQEVGGGTSGTEGKFDKFKETLSKVFGQTNKTSSATNTLEKNMKKLSSAMKGFNASTGKAVIGLKSFARQALSAMGIYLGVYGAIRGLKNAIESSMNYVETLNYFNAAFGQVAEKADLNSFKKMGYDSAEAYYNSFSERAEQLTQKMTGFKVSESGALENTRILNLGIDPNQLMNYQATFAQMSSSMGVTSETASKLSNALTMIGADLASVKNMDFNKVWNDMASGLAGMSRTLDKYGVNIRNANLQQELNNLGLEANITKLNQNDKALLRTTILLNNTTFAWGDMARTIEQPANQLRLLKSNFANLGRTIGNLFLPIIAKALPYINGFVIALQRLTEQLVTILGFEGFDWGGIGSSNFDMSSLYDEADALDEVAEKSKKASDNLQSFDKINKLSDDDTESDKINSTGITGALNDAFLKALSEYEKKWNEAFSNMDSKALKVAEDVEKNLKKMFNSIANASGPTRKAINKLWNQGFKKLKNFTWGTLKDFWESFLKPVGKWMLSDNSGLPRFFNITNDLLNEIDWNKLRKSLNGFYKVLAKLAKISWTALMDFYESFLKPISKWTLSKALPEMLDILSEFASKIKWDYILEKLKKFWGILSKFTIGVGNGLIRFFRDFSKISAPVINGIAKAIGLLVDALSAIPTPIIESVGNVLGYVAGAFIAMKFLSTAGAAIATGIKMIQLAIASLSGPIGIMIAFAAALSGISDVVEFFKEPIELGGYVEGTEKIVILTDSVKKAIDDAGKAMDNFNSSTEEIASKYAYVQGIADEYYELSKNYNILTDEQKNLLKTYSEILSENVDGVDKFIDPITKAYAGTKKELNKLISKTEEYYITLAAKEELEEIGKSLFNLQKEYSNVNSELESWLYNQESEKLKAQSSDLNTLVKALQRVNGKYEELTESEQELYKKYAGEDNAVSGWIEKVKHLGDNVSAVEDSISDTKGEMKTLTQIISTNGKEWEKTIGKANNYKEVEKTSKKTNEKIKESAQKAIFEINNSITDFTRGTKTNMGDMAKSGSTSAQDLKKNFSNGLVGLGTALPGILSNVKTNFNSTASSVGTSGGDSLVNAFGLQTSFMTNKAMISIGNLQKDKNLLTKANAVGGNLGKEIGKGVSEGLIEKASKILSSFKNIFKDFKFELNTDTVKKGAKLAFKFAFPHLKGFATGGYPNLSSPFVVGENGPEIMGGMYGKPAVANNNSITEGIEEAAYRGMARALAEGGRNGTINVTVELAGDSKKFFTAMQREARQYKAQTGYGAFPV